LKISEIAKYFCKTAKIDFFSLSAQIKEAKERAKTPPTQYNT